MLVSVIILVGLFSIQHYGTDRIAWLFAPVVFLWFVLIGGIGIINIWKYDTHVLKAFSPVYIYRYFKKGGIDGWTSLGGTMLSITGNVFFINLTSIVMFYNVGTCRCIIHACKTGDFRIQ